MRSNAGSPVSESDAAMQLTPRPHGADESHRRPIESDR